MCVYTALNMDQKAHVCLDEYTIQNCNYTVCPKKTVTLSISENSTDTPNPWPKHRYLILHNSKLRSGTAVPLLLKNRYPQVSVLELQIPNSQSRDSSKIPDSQSRDSSKIPDSED